MSKLEERFFNKVEMIPFHSCWEWTGTKSQTGYSRMSVKCKDKLVHRIAYELFVGPIPEWAELDHLCRNRGCVNPRHLEPVSRLENQRRSPLTIMGRNTYKTVCKSGHKLEGENVYFRTNGARSCRQCRLVYDLRFRNKKSPDRQRRRRSKIHSY